MSNPAPSHADPIPLAATRSHRATCNTLIRGALELNLMPFGTHPEFHQRQEPHVWWHLSRTGTARTPALHGPVRRPDFARGNTDDDYLAAGLRRHGGTHCARGGTRGHPR